MTGEPRRQVAGFTEAKRSLLDEKSILTFESNITKRNSGLFFLVSTSDLSIKEKGS